MDVNQPTVGTRPIVQIAQWTAVMEAAGYQCRCLGDCGGHRRCFIGHDSYLPEFGYIHLLAAPADLSIPAWQAVTLPTDQLRAWCPGCHRRTLTRIKKARKTEIPTTNALFDL
jgi:hypothetical protein